MNWQVLSRTTDPADYTGDRLPDRGLVHVRVEGDTHSLCSAASIEDGRWECPDADLHPEDTDPAEQCSVCFSVLERRRTEESGRAPRPSNRLNGHVRSLRAPSLADTLGAMA